MHRKDKNKIHEPSHGCQARVPADRDALPLVPDRILQPHQQLPGLGQIREFLGARQQGCQQPPGLARLAQIDQNPSQMIGHGRVIGQGLVGLAQELQGRVLVAQAVLAGVSAGVSETQNLPISFTFLAKKALFSTLE